MAEHCQSWKPAVRKSAVFSPENKAQESKREQCSFMILDWSLNSERNITKNECRKAESRTSPSWWTKRRREDWWWRPGSFQVLFTNRFLPMTIPKMFEQVFIVSLWDLSIALFSKLLNNWRVETQHVSFICTWLSLLPRIQTNFAFLLGKKMGNPCLRWQESIENFFALTTIRRCNKSQVWGQLLFLKQQRTRYFTMIA